jgi:hypothetical protein
MGIDKNKAPMGIPTRTKWHYGKQPQVLDLQNLDEISIPAANRAYNERQRRGEEALKKSDYKTATGHFTKAVKTVHMRAKKHATVDAGGVVREGRIRQGKESGWWMADFEKHVVKANPQHAGKISWDDAQFHHNQGRTPEEAAKKYTSSHPTPFESHFHRESEELNEDLRPRGWTPADEHNRWSKEFEHHVVRLEPKHAGKVDHKYGSKLSDMLLGPQEAAKIYVKDHKKQSQQAKIKSDMAAAGSKRDYDDHYMEEGVIEHLRKVKEFDTDKPLKHKNGSHTMVDPTTAHALLTVHDALHPDNQKKFADHLGHSQHKFHKMLDFTWKNVK